MNKPLKLVTDDEVTDCFVGRFTAPELRKLASNIKVSRERGDNKRQTAERITEQAPAVAAALVENDPEVEMTATEFKELREVDSETISLDEAMRRAKNKKMHYMMKRLYNSYQYIEECYEVDVDWEYTGPGGLTSIVIRARDDWETNPLLKEHEQLIITSRGRITSPKKIANAESSRRKFRVFCRMMESWWCS